MPFLYFGVVRLSEAIRKRTVIHESSKKKTFGWSTGSIIIMIEVSRGGDITPGPWYGVIESLEAANYRKFQVMSSHS